MKRIHIITAIMILGGIGLLISATKDMTTYGTFSLAEQSGKRLKVVGTLAKEMPIVYNPEKDANYFSFYMNDQDGLDRKVVLKRPKTQDFERSEQIVATGKMVDEVFMADEILLKCPSKYKDEEINLRNQS